MSDITFQYLLLGLWLKILVLIETLIINFLTLRFGKKIKKIKKPRSSQYYHRWWGRWIVTATSWSDTIIKPSCLKIPSNICPARRHFQWLPMTKCLLWLCRTEPHGVRAEHLSVQIPQNTAQDAKLISKLYGFCISSFAMADRMDSESDLFCFQVSSSQPRCWISPYP